MTKYDYVLFDLDGTLTDSGPGIMSSFAYAVEKMGDSVEDKQQFRRFVGPPLRDSFEKSLGYSSDDADKAVAFYREYYFGMGGALENTVYPGIEELLAGLKAEGKKLIVATSKAEKGTKLVLEHFGLDKYFDFVATSNDADRKYKIDVIRYALDMCGIKDLDRAVMVGDRESDISAAAEAGMDSIGVLYGYGDEEELTTAGATFIAETAEDVGEIIRKNN